MAHLRCLINTDTLHLIKFTFSAFRQFPKIDPSFYAQPEIRTKLVSTFCNNSWQGVNLSAIVEEFAVISGSGLHLEAEKNEKAAAQLFSNLK